MTPTPVSTATSQPASSTGSSELLTILEHVGIVLKILLPVAQAISAPFIKSANAKAIVATEVPIAQGTAEVLSEIGQLQGNQLQGN